MSIHIGAEIKKRAKELGIGSTELSKAIHTSKQNINGIFKRRTIDTGLLKEISRALEYDFFQYYQAGGPDGRDKIIRAVSAENKALKDQVQELKKQAAENEILYLKKINHLLEKKKV